MLLCMVCQLSPPAQVDSDLQDLLAAAWHAAQAPHSLVAPICCVNAFTLSAGALLVSQLAALAECMSGCRWQRASWGMSLPTEVPQFGGPCACRTLKPTLKGP